MSEEQNQTIEQKTKYSGFAIVAFVFSILALILTILALVFLLFLFIYPPKGPEPAMAFFPIFWLFLSFIPIISLVGLFWFISFVQIEELKIRQFIVKDSWCKKWALRLLIFDIVAWILVFVLFLFFPDAENNFKV